MMDFMTVRHSNNDVLDDAVDNRKHCTENRRAVRALKLGLESPPFVGQVPREPAFMFGSMGHFVLK